MYRENLPNNPLMYKLPKIVDVALQLGSGQRIENFETYDESVSNRLLVETWMLTPLILRA